jgi:cytochrome b561
MPHIGRNTVPETLINLHFSLGVLVLGLAIVRLAWRWTHPEPTPLDGLPPWQVKGAHATHLVLYLLLFILPALGWVNASYRGFAVSRGAPAMPTKTPTIAPTPPAPEMIIASLRNWRRMSTVRAPDQTE